MKFERNKSFRKNEDGTATVETVLWLPVLFLIFILIINASFVFYKQTIMLRVVQDANRALSVGRITTIAATQTMITTRLANLSSNSTAKTTVDLATGIITSTAEIPVADMVFDGNWNLLKNFKVRASAQHFVEY